MFIAVIIDKPNIFYAKVIMISSPIIKDCLKYYI